MTMTELLAWNPIIWQRDCGNMDAMVGRTICVSPPNTEEYTPVNLTVTWAHTWSTPAGSWVTAATEGTQAPNSTARTAFFPRTPLPTATIAWNATEYNLVEKYAQHCPISAQDFEDGFQWYHLSSECFDLLFPYCSPRTEGPMPTPTTFPRECMPSVVMQAHQS
jgi:hypothetical protein